MKVVEVLVPSGQNVFSPDLMLVYSDTNMASISHLRLFHGVMDALCVLRVSELGGTRDVPAGNELLVPDNLVVVCARCLSISNVSCGL